MKLLILGILFLPIVYLALRQRKWYLYLLIAFMGILPEQFALELHEKLPLISGTRVLIVIVMAFWLWDRWKSKRLVLPVSLLAFFTVNLLVSLVNFRNGSDEINRIFLLIFERVLLAVMIADTVADRQEFERCMDFLILGCTALAVIGIVQNVFDYDLATPLHLTETMSSIRLSDRMGMTRAYGTFNAITYGCYCAFMALPIYYRIAKTGKWYYSAAFALNTMALVCTLTRSAWMCLGGILLVMILVHGGKLIRKILPALAMTMALCVLLCLAQPRLTGAFVETGKSTINTVLSLLPGDFSGAQTPGNDAVGKPEKTEKPGFELSEDFGENGEDPSYSRMAQWTAVEYMAKHGDLLFGYGYNALPEGRIHFFFDRWEAKWEPTTFLDVGLVALIAESGIIGTVCMLGLLGYLFIISWRRRDRQGNFDFYKLTLYMLPLFLLLNFLASFMFDDVVYVFIALFYAYKRIEPNGACNRDCLVLQARRAG